MSFGKSWLDAFGLGELGSPEEGGESEDFEFERLPLDQGSEPEQTILGKYKREDPMRSYDQDQDQVSPFTRRTPAEVYYDKLREDFPRYPIINIASHGGIESCSSSQEDSSSPDSFFLQEGKTLGKMTAVVPGFSNFASSVDVSTVSKKLIENAQDIENFMAELSNTPDEIVEEVKDNDTHIIRRLRESFSELDQTFLKDIQGRIFKGLPTDKHEQGYLHHHDKSYQFTSYRTSPVLNKEFSRRSHEKDGRFPTDTAITVMNMMGTPDLFTLILGRAGRSRDREVINFKELMDFVFNDMGAVGCFVYDGSCSSQFGKKKKRTTYASFGRSLIKDGLLGGRTKKRTTKKKTQKSSTKKRKLTKTQKSPTKKRKLTKKQK